MNEPETSTLGEPIPLPRCSTRSIACGRRAYQLERLWAENRFTAEGQVLHVHADKPMVRAQCDVRRVTALERLSTGLNRKGIPKSALV